MCTILKCLLVKQPSSILWPVVLCDFQVSGLRMEINQASGDQLVRGTTYYDIPMGNDLARDAHCDITMGNDVTKDIHCQCTMSNGVSMCTYHGITMHNNVATNLFIMYYYGYLWYFIMGSMESNKNKFMLDQSGQLSEHIVLCRVISLILRTHKISLHNSPD